MRFFEELAREQATLYRWLLENLSAAELLTLTGKNLAGARPEHVDEALRQAYHFDRFRSSEVIADVQAKAGILPQDIGWALLEYGNACAAKALDDVMPDSNLDTDEMERCKMESLRRLTDILLRRIK